MTEMDHEDFESHNKSFENPDYTGGNGTVDILASYKQKPVVAVVETGLIVDAALQFDIERHISWDQDYRILPFTYSMMIGGCYSGSRLPFGREKRRPTLAEFEEAALSLDGFRLDDNSVHQQGQRRYVNLDHNVFINWMSHPKKVSFGVVQETPVANLTQVTDEIVPYAVSVFNRLSPTNKIHQDIVDKYVAEALKANQASSQRRSAA